MAETDTKKTGPVDLTVFKSPMPKVLPSGAARTNSLLQQVEVLFFKYWTDPEFNVWLNSMDSKDAVEGKFDFDRAHAAKFLKDKAKVDGAPLVAQSKGSKIANKIEAILRRVDLGRKQRRLSYQTRAAE